MNAFVAEPGEMDFDGLEWISTEQALPPPEQPVLYRTALYQAAGHLDNFGAWHFNRDNIESSPVLRWTPIG